MSESNHTGQIVVTGAAGFIGSCMVQYLNEKGYTNLILVDDFGVEGKRKNWESKQYDTIVERYQLFEWLLEHRPQLDFVVHLGARTDTTEFDYSIHQELNVEFSEKVWNYCTIQNIPLIYASSAATYGGGEHGYIDDHGIIEQLHPLNPYGISKNEFDKWVLHQEDHPPFWAGLKFFNVYGPNEYHKGRMASVIFHAYNQIQKNGYVNLFRSHRPDFKDGQQLRDFVYVKDVVNVILWMMERTMQNGPWTISDTDGEPASSSVVSASVPSAIYNLGTGIARSFYDLAAATFKGLDKEPDIRFIDMPEDIRDKYQYFTEANMEKLHNAGYETPFHTLEEGVDDYVRHYLSQGKWY